MDTTYTPMARYFQAHALVLTPEAGGRATPVFDGYRPDWRLGPCESGTHLGRVNEQHRINGGPIRVIGADTISSGGYGLILIQAFAPEFWTHVTEGSFIEMCEGNRVVALVTVIHRFAEWPAALFPNKPPPGMPDDARR